MSPRAILVGGGARSGKSAFALRRACELGERRVFIATAQAFDAEMSARIATHRLERGERFRTVEAPLALPELLRDEAAGAEVIVVDCLTLWLSNLLLQERSDRDIAQRIGDLASLLRARPCHVIMVTNEVGMGLVPDNALGRRFRDCAGRAHQQLAGESDEIYVAVLGCVMRLRPGPVELVGPAASLLPTASVEESHVEP